MMFESLADDGVASQAYGGLIVDSITGVISFIAALELGVQFGALATQRSLERGFAARAPGPKTGTAETK